MNKLDNILKIYSLLEIGTWDLDKTNQPYKSFGLPHKSLNIIGQNNLLEFEGLINALYEHEKDIFNSFSHKVFVERLISTVGQAKFNNETITNETVKKFFNELKSEPLVDFYVYREIFDITLNENKKLTFGNF